MGLKGFSQSSVPLGSWEQDPWACVSSDLASPKAISVWFLGRFKDQPWGLPAADVGEPCSRRCSAAPAGPGCGKQLGVLLGEQCVWGAEFHIKQVPTLQTFCFTLHFSL